jgi:chromosome segregation ATPase
MQDWGKSRRPPRERSRPPAKDPRADSEPPASSEETPLRSRPPSSAPRVDSARIAALQADIERLKSEHAHDADQVAEMLVRIAAAERAREGSERARDAAERAYGDAEQRAAAAEQRAATLAAEVERLKQRAAELEADAWDPAGGSARDAQARFEATRAALARVGAMIDELDRREEIAGTIRARTIEQVRQALAEAEAPPSPPLQPARVISVQPPKPMRERMAEPEPFPTE